MGESRFVEVEASVGGAVVFGVEGGLLEIVERIVLVEGGLLRAADDAVRQVSVLLRQLQDHPLHLVQTARAGGGLLLVGVRAGELRGGGRHRRGRRLGGGGVGEEGVLGGGCGVGVRVGLGDVLGFGIQNGGSEWVVGICFGEGVVVVGGGCGFEVLLGVDF